MTLPIPAEALEDAGIVLGRRGAGKSNALMCLFEHELDAGHRAVMIDPKGDRWGVRLDPDGSASRFTIPIFGGDHGDVPLDASMGETIGLLVAEHDLSCLIDLSQMSLVDKQKFMMGFAPILLQHNRAALTLFIEEVDQFANQDPRYQPPMLVHHIANFATLGRQRGIVPWVASQRPAKVNATVRSQADTFIGMKVTTPLDRDAYRDWFKGHGKEAAGRVEEEVGRLKPGEALVWIGSSDFFGNVKFPMASTFDSGRTPKHGERIQAVQLPPIDIDAIRDALTPTCAKIAKVEEPAPTRGPKIADPDAVDATSPAYVAQLMGENSDLRARVAALESQRDDWMIERSVGQQQLDALVNENITLRDHIDTIARAAADLALIPKAYELIEVEAVGTGVEDRPPAHLRSKGSLRPANSSERPPATLRSDSVARPGPTRDTPAASTPAGKIGAERRPLAVLAGVYPSGLTEAQWGTAAGMKRTGGTWGTYKSRLRSKGLIEQNGAGMWFATQQGAEAVGDVETPPPPGEALVCWWLRKLQGVTPMAQVLLARWPQWTSREDLAGYLGMSAAGGTFGTYLSRLSGPGLIERDKNRGIRLSPDVMGPA